MAKLCRLDVTNETDFVLLAGGSNQGLCMPDELPTMELYPSLFTINWLERPVADRPGEAPLL